MTLAIADAPEGIAATRRLLETIDRMADRESPRLIDHPRLQSVDVLELWPAFSVWLIGGKSAKHRGGLIEMTVPVPAIQDQLEHLIAMLHASKRGLVIEQVWRSLRAELGVLSHDWLDEDMHAGHDGATAIAERTPHRHLVSNAAEAGADIAWAMYCDPRWIESATTLAVRYTGEAWGWTMAQAEWTRSSGAQPREMWRPAVAEGRRDFARRATSYLLEQLS